MYLPPNYSRPSSVNTKKFAIAKCNRPIDSKTVKTLSKTLKEDGQFTQPICTIDPRIAPNETYYDFDTNTLIPSTQLGNYAVIVDGQHRAKAYADQDYNMQKIPRVDKSEMFKSSGKSLGSFISTFQGSKPWTADDYVNAEVKQTSVEIDPAMEEIRKLRERGWSHDALRHAMGVSTEVYNKKVRAKDFNSVEIERTNRVIDAIEKAGVKKQRGNSYYPEVIKREVTKLKKDDSFKGNALEKVLDTFGYIPPREIKRIDELKGATTLRNAIQKAYNDTKKALEDLINE